MPDWLLIILQVVSAALLALYLAGIAVNTAVAIYRRFRPNVMSSQHPILDRWVGVVQRDGRRYRLTNLLLTVQLMAAWPVLGQAGGRMLGRETNLQFRAWISLELIDRLCALFDALLIIAVALLVHIKGIGEPVALTFAAVVLAGTVFRHLSYLLVGIGDRLRLSKWAPAKILALIAVSDAITLLLIVSLALHFHFGDILSWSLIREAAAELYGFANLPSLPEEPPLNVAVALLGLLFYSAVIKTIFSPKTFGREDADYGKVAWSFVCAGEYAQAGAWLRKQQEINIVTFNVRAAIGMATGDFAQALSSAVNAQNSRGEDATTDAALLRLWGLRMMALPPDEDRTVAFLDQCLQRQASDTLLCVTFANSVSSGLLSLERLPEILGRLDADAYPIARALALAWLDEPLAARQILEGASPGSEIEELLRLLYSAELNLIDSRLTDDARLEFLNDWLRDEFPVVEELSWEIPEPWKRSATTSLASFANLVANISPGAEVTAMRLVRQLSADVMSDDQLDRWLGFQRELLPQVI